MERKWTKKRNHQRKYSPRKENSPSGKDSELEIIKQSEWKKKTISINVKYKSSCCVTQPAVTWKQVLRGLTGHLSRCWTSLSPLPSPPGVLLTPAPALPNEVRSVNLPLHQDYGRLSGWPSCSQTSPAPARHPLIHRVLTGGSCGWDSLQWVFFHHWPQGGGTVPNPHKLTSLLRWT